MEIFAYVVIFLAIGSAMSAIYRLCSAANERTKSILRRCGTVGLVIALLAIPAAVLFPGPVSRYQGANWGSSIAHALVVFGAIAFLLLPLWLTLLESGNAWLQRQRTALLIVGAVGAFASPVGLIAALIVSSIQAGAGL
jgi:hypothetical protein